MITRIVYRPSNDGHVFKTQKDLSNGAYPPNWRTVADFTSLIHAREAYPAATIHGIAELNQKERETRDHSWERSNDAGDARCFYCGHDGNWLAHRRAS